MVAISKVLIDSELLTAILESGKSLYPKETVLLLRGKKQKDAIRVSDLLIPPLVSHGRHSAYTPLHMLPVDFSIMGTLHSHPSGNLTPSSTDLNHFFGKVLLIIGFPFADASNIAAYDRDGKKLRLEIA
jgi:proteasome lid subunit RPN8/RPN11